LIWLDMRNYFVATAKREDEYGYPMVDTPCYCPFCGSPDIDDPSYFVSEEDEDT